MKAAEMRKLIGKKISFVARGWRCSGTVLEVAGRNVRIGDPENWDWHWIPDMSKIAAA